MIDMRNFIKYMPSQFNVQCCTSNASLLAIEIIYNMNNYPVRFSRLYTYYMTRKLQNRIGLHGAELSYALRSLSEHGACMERLWPFGMKRIDHAPTDECNVSASDHKVFKYTSIVPGQINEALDDGIPVILGMHTGRQFWKLAGSLQEQCYQPINTVNNRLSKGHAVTLVGYNEKGWIAGNSLGPLWGDNGFGLIPYNCISDFGEIYIITDVAGLTTGKKFPIIDK